MRQEVRFTGYGGQGIALMAALFGKAAALFDNKHAVLTQSYGPESRGGASNADVVIDDQSVDFPLVARPNILVVMFQEAYDRFRPTLKKCGILFVDTGLVRVDKQDKDCFGVPALKLAEELGKKMVANVVMLGYFGAASALVRREALEEAIRKTVKSKFIDLNIEAFARGYEWSKNKAVAGK